MEIKNLKKVLTKEIILSEEESVMFGKIAIEVVIVWTITEEIKGGRVRDVVGVHRKQKFPE